MRLEMDSDKRRLLIELSAIEQYNQTHDPEYRIALSRKGSTLIGECILQPTINRYRVRFTLGEGYPAAPPAITILEPQPPSGCPHFLGGNTPCLFRGTGSGPNSWDPSRHTAVFAVLCTWRWLLCLDLWITTGNWGLPDANASQEYYE
jgi:hypothetical protein